LLKQFRDGSADVRNADEFIETVSELALRELFASWKMGVVRGQRFYFLRRS
jgi:hypothetical protein